MVRKDNPPQNPTHNEGRGNFQDRRSSAGGHFSNTLGQKKRPSISSAEIHFSIDSAAEQLERLGAELELERARLQTTLDNIPVGVVLAEAPSGRILMGNAEVEKILRHPILSSADVDSYGEWVGFHPDGRRVQAREWPLARALNGQTIRNEEFLYQRGDGTTAWIEVSAAPIYGRDKRITGSVVAVHDIDFQKRSAEEIKNSARRFRAIFEQVYSFFVILNQEGVIVDVNRATLQITGLKRSRLLGYQIWEAAWWAQAGEEQRRLKKAVEATLNGRPFRGEMRFSSADGNVRILDLSLTPVKNERGELAFIVASGVDITQRRQAEELIGAWDREKLAARIAHSLAHEINNPLEILTNCLYLMQTSASDASQAYLSAAQEAMTRVTAISGELLGVFSGRKLNHQYASEIMGRKSELDLIFGVLENLNDAVIACDKTGAVKFMNHAARQIYGTPRLQDAGSGCASALGVYHPDGETLLKDRELPLYRAVNGETVKDVPLVIKPPGAGGAWHMLADASPVMDEDQSLIGAFVVCRIGEQISGSPKP